MAHTAGAALQLGVEDKKLEAVWEFRSSELFSAKERAALEVAVAGAAQPNEVTDDLFAELKRHWNEGEIVEIVAVISMFGFMNRWKKNPSTSARNIWPKEAGASANMNGKPSRSLCI